MGAKETGLGIFIVVLLSCATLIVKGPAAPDEPAETSGFDVSDPL